MIKKIINRLKQFFPQCKLYGFPVAFWSLVYPLYRIMGPIKPFFCILKHKAILKYLYIKNSILMHRYAGKKNDLNENIKSDSTIWVCWWDGYEAMPPLVKVCYASILENAGTHPVQLITKDNYFNYITIPDYIMEKVSNKIITITHFSNIIRANLIHDYGGIWLDATILVLQKITLDDLPFFTLKAPAEKSVSVTLSRFSKHYKIFENPQISRWSGFLLAGTKGSIIFAYMRDILYAYWKNHNNQIDYVLYDYTIALGYEYISAVRQLIDYTPLSAVEKFEMENNMNNEYSDSLFEQFTQTTFHKLTWKKKFDTCTNENKMTLYGHLIGKIL